MTKTYFRFAISMPSGGVRYRSLVTLGDEAEAREQLVREHDGFADEVFADRAHLVYALDDSTPVVPLDQGHKRTCWATPRLDAIAFGLEALPPDNTISRRCLVMLLKMDMSINDLYSTLLYQEVEATNNGWRELGRLRRLWMWIRLKWWLKGAQKMKLVQPSGGSLVLRPLLRDGSQG